MIKWDSPSLHKSNSCVHYKPYRHIHFRTSVTRTWELLKNSYISTATICSQNGLTTLPLFHNMGIKCKILQHFFFRFWKRKCCAEPVQHVNSLTDLLSSKVMQIASNSVTEAWHVVSWHALLFSEIQGLTIYVAVGHNHHINYSQISCTFQHALPHLIFMCELVIHEWWMCPIYWQLYYGTILSILLTKKMEIILCLLSLYVWVSLSQPIYWQRSRLLCRRPPVWIPSGISVICEWYLLYCHSQISWSQ